MNDIEIGLMRQAMAYHGRSEASYRTVTFSANKRMYVTPADPDQFIGEGDVGYNLLRDAIRFTNSKPVSTEEKRAGRKNSELDAYSKDTMYKLLQHSADKKLRLGQEQVIIGRIKRDYEYHVWFHRQTIDAPQFHVDESVFRNIGKEDADRLTKIALG